MNINKIIKAFNTIAYMIFFIITFNKIGEVGAGILAVTGVTTFFAYMVLFGGQRDIVSKMVGNRIRRGFNSNAKRVFYFSTLMSLVLSGLYFGIMFICGDSIAKGLFGDGLSSSLGLFAAVALIFICLCDNFKGYYIGCGGSLFLILGDIVKDLALVIATPFALNYFTEYGTKVAALKNDGIMTGLYGAIGCLVIMIVSYVIMLLILISGIRTVNRNDNFSFNEVRSNDGFRTYLRSFLPAYLKKLRKNICPALIFFIGIMILVKSNFRNELARELVYSEVARLVFGAFIFVSVGLFIFEETAYSHYSGIRADFKKEDRKGVLNKFTTFAKAMSVIIIPSFVIIVTLAKNVAINIVGCKVEDLTSVFIAGAIVFLLAAADKVLCIGLEAVNMELSILLGNAISFVINLLYILMSSKNGISITALSWGMVIYFAVCFLIHGFFAVKNINIKFNDYLAKLIKTAISVLPVLIIDLILAKFISMNCVIVLIVMVISYIAYSFVLVLIRGMNQKDINSMQGSILYYIFYFFAAVFHIR